MLQQNFIKLRNDLSGALRAFVRARAPESDVDDILQDSFIKIHDKIHTLKSEEKMVSWVYQIVRNTIVDHHRQRPRHAPLEGNPEPVEPAPADNRDTRVGRWLAGMVKTLPAPYAEAVRLVELEGVPQKSLGQKLGVSGSGAKSRVQRGRKMLKEALLRCCHLEFDRRGGVLATTPRQSNCCRTESC
jgi:RNA polymerase sigma-70 factor (ECF subfamily)